MDGMGHTKSLLNSTIWESAFGIPVRLQYNDHGIRELIQVNVMKHLKYLGVS